MADTRICEHCGDHFAPRREHARFCTARCRVAWNREKMRNPAAEVSALEWSVTAMRDTTERLPRLRPWDRPRAFAVIGEAVWWVTIVDATLVRHHPDAYDSVLAGQDPARRRLIEETLGGLRFVRNRMGQETDHVDFVHAQAGRAGPGYDRITAWTWKPVPRPALASLPPRGRSWEMTRYRAYEAQLAGRTIGETFGRAAAFLKLAAATAANSPGSLAQSTLVPPAAAAGLRYQAGA
jgi:hypothetical protein